LFAQSLDLAYLLLTLTNDLDDAFVVVRVVCLAERQCTWS